MKELTHESKRRIAAAVSVLIVFTAALSYFLRKPEKAELAYSDNEYYETVKLYMQSEYTSAYSDFFEAAYVEELSDYKEKYDPELNLLEAEFTMDTYYKYPYRDPDTIPNVRKAREAGDMDEYKRLYDECNRFHSAEYRLKIDARVSENMLEDVRLYGGTENGDWIILEKGLKEYITEE